MISGLFGAEDRFHINNIYIFILYLQLPSVAEFDTMACVLVMCFQFLRGFHRKRCSECHPSSIRETLRPLQFEICYYC